MATKIPWLHKSKSFFIVATYQKMNESSGCRHQKYRKRTVMLKKRNQNYNRNDGGTTEVLDYYWRKGLFGIDLKLGCAPTTRFCLEPNLEIYIIASSFQTNSQAFSSAQGSKSASFLHVHSLLTNKKWLYLSF